MQLRMLERRSLNGSMTLVGDIAQATGAWAHNDWNEIIEAVPSKKQPRFAELTVGYRLPQPTGGYKEKAWGLSLLDLAQRLQVK